MIARRYAGVLAFLTTLPLLAGSAFAEPEKGATGAVDPEAKAFIDSFRAAIGKITDLSCTSVQENASGSTKTTQSGDVVIAIKRERERGMPGRFRIAFKTEDADAVVAFDGETAYRIDRAKHTFQSMKAPEGKAYPVTEAMGVIPVWTFGTDVLSNPMAALTAAKLLPDATRDGVRCRVVEYTVETAIPEAPPEEGAEPKKSDAGPPKMITRQTRYIGADDLMPRRIESRNTYEGTWEEPMEARTFTGTFTNVRVNANPSTEAFILHAGAGDKTIEPEAQDLGLPTKEHKLKFKVGETAPDFALKNSEGNEVTLGSLKGRVVLLDFWATWCGPCKAAMPGVQKLHEKYQGQNVSVFGVDVFERGDADKAAAKAKKYMADQKFTYGLLLKGDQLAKAYGINSIPTFVLIGPDGKVLHTNVGFDPEGEAALAAVIDQALAKK